MKISIITPVYNTAQTLEKTILSVINQPINSELEYIIIDGGSKDGTLEIIQRYSDRIAVVISEKDDGIYDAMNKGLSYATGDIIGIVNADDWYNDGALKCVEDAFSEDSELSILYSPVENYFQGKFFNTFTPGSLENLPLKFVLNHPSCFVKKQVYDTLGSFNVCYSIVADYDFILRAYNSKFKFGLIETPLASYSLNGMSGFEAPLAAKLKQLKESWQVSSGNIHQSQADLVIQHKIFYLNSLLKILITYPFKKLGLITPTRTNQIKQFVRKNFGPLSADKYGNW
jgi:glycosyltransferase involved in cell wall biosynthesis